MYEITKAIREDDSVAHHMCQNQFGVQEYANELAERTLRRGDVLKDDE